MDDDKALASEYRNVLITGVAGSVGQALLGWLVKNGSTDMRILGIDNCEGSVAELQRSYAKAPNVTLRLANICDAATMDTHCEGVDLLIHLAALKHVAIGEQSPDQIIASNLLGLQNVIDAARRNRVAQMIFTSSDKAILPSNAMGASKLIGERLMSAANDTATATRYTSVRFGNVLGSNGSVVPIFRKQLNEGGPITLTHPDMTRFVMTLSTCARMLMTAANLAQGGEILVTRMPVMRIGELAQAMIEEHVEQTNQPASDFKVVNVGIQAGEKIHEGLMTDTEADSAYLIEDQYDAYYFVSPTEVKNATGKSRACEIMRPPQTSANVAPMPVAAIKAALRDMQP